MLHLIAEYELNRSVNVSDFPPLLCVITGKGPLKDFYLKAFQERKWNHIEICTPWLEPEDYPKIIGLLQLLQCLLILRIIIKLCYVDV